MSYNTVLSRAFTKKSFMDLVEERDSSIYNTIINRHLREASFDKNADVINSIYEVLLKSYRNEYVYKNILLNKLLLGRHSLRTTTALAEVPVNKSKADFILINGTATVYEIKTELDSFDRLETQLKDYYKAFAKVFVITSESQYKKISQLLEGTNVGICVLTARNKISTRKEAIFDDEYLDSTTMFKVLRKHEYEEILKDHYSYLPDVSPVKYYSESLEMFKKIERKIAYKYMVAVLKKRATVIVDAFSETVPKELSSLVYFSGFKRSEYVTIHRFLNEGYRGF